MQDCYQAIVPIKKELFWGNAVTGDDFVMLHRIFVLGGCCGQPKKKIMWCGGSMGTLERGDERYLGIKSVHVTFLFLPEAQMAFLYSSQTQFPFYSVPVICT